jgi:hypothetical protein
MHSFVDNSRRTWEVAINVAAVKRIRGLLGIDLYALVDDGFKSLSKIVSDPVTLADVLYCLCKDQADKQSISDEDFGRALAGDAITHAADAFVEELIDFFPDARARTRCSATQRRSSIRSTRKPKPRSGSARLALGRSPRL